MRPVLFHIGAMSFHSYTVMFCLAFLVAAVLAVRENQRRERPFPITTLGGVWAFAGGILGAKVYWWVQYGEWADLKWGEFLLTGGLVFFGGLIGGVLGVVLYLRRVGAPVIPVSDLALPYVALAHAVARVGCFLNGCCWGGHTTLPWGVCYPKSSWGAYHQQIVDGLLARGAETSLPAHPVQLYETIGLLILFAALRAAYRRKPPAGTVACGYLAGYGGLRFAVEFFRGDSAHPLGGLTASQGVAAALFLTGVLGLVYVRCRAGREGICSESEQNAVSKDPAAETAFPEEEESADAPQNARIPASDRGMEKS